MLQEQFASQLSRIGKSKIYAGKNLIRCGPGECDQGDDVGAGLCAGQKL